MYALAYSKRQKHSTCAGHSVLEYQCLAGQLEQTDTRKQQGTVFWSILCIYTAAISSACIQQLCHIHTHGLRRLRHAALVSDHSSCAAQARLGGNCVACHLKQRNRHIALDLKERIEMYIPRAAGVWMCTVCMCTITHPRHPRDAQRKRKEGPKMKLVTRHMMQDTSCMQCIASH